MNVLKALAAGLAGAATLTLLHEVLRRTTPDAPRMDVLGQRAIGRAAAAMGRPVPQGARLQRLVLGGDLLSNTIYFAAVAHGGPGAAFRRGALLGLTAGIGGVVLPGRMGLGTDASSRTNTTRALTIGLYLAAGAAAAATYCLLGTDSSDK